MFCRTVSRGQFHEAKPQRKTPPGFFAELKIPFQMRGKIGTTLSHEIDPWAQSKFYKHEARGSLV